MSFFFKKKEMTMKISMYFCTVAIIFMKCLNTFQTYLNFVAYISRSRYDHFAGH